MLENTKFLQPASTANSIRFSDPHTLLRQYFAGVSIDSPTGPEALLAAVMGGDAEWLDDAPSATLAVQNVRPVLDSWSIDVTDVEAEIQSILAGPTS